MWYVPLKPNTPFQLRSKEKGGGRGGEADTACKKRGEELKNLDLRLAFIQLGLLHAVFFCALRPGLAPIAETELLSCPACDIHLAPLRAQVQDNSRIGTDNADKMVSSTVVFLVTSTIWWRRTGNSLPTPSSMVRLFALAPSAQCCQFGDALS